MSRSLAILILAAGQGTRMQSSRPKVLHPVANRPMIGHALAAAKALAPDRVIAVIGPEMDAAAQAIAPTPTVIQALQRGTADAVAAARSALGDFAGEVLVLYGDTPLTTPATLERLLAERVRQNAAVAVIGMRPAEPGAYGRLVLDPDGALAAIVEAKDATDEQRRIALCNSGVMAIDGRHLWPLLDAVGNSNAKHEYYLTDIVGIARTRGLRCAAIEAPAAEMMGVNSRAELAEAEALMQGRLRAAAMAAGVTFTAPETVFLSADTRLGRDCVVGPFVVFGPEVTVGDGVEIPAFCHLAGAKVGDHAILGPFARLRPGAELGAHVHIGNFVEVKNAKLASGVKANHLAYLGDANVGEGTNIGAGTITCNYDGVDKHRTEIGKDVFVGTNSSLVAPVAIGDGAMIGAGSVITEDVPADALALGRGRQVVKEGRAAAWKKERRAATPAKKKKR
jgi:bifunctional UDP-N-acetylglucosamine pyrophosphorylase / glucosamine-1-phosphate N-acetyltransferase